MKWEIKSEGNSFFNLKPNILRYLWDTWENLNVHKVEIVFPFISYNMLYSVFSSILCKTMCFKTMRDGVC
jgi:hypothetical protein